MLNLIDFRNLDRLILIYKRSKDLPLETKAKDPEKRTAKERRQLGVLFGLIEYYMETGKPVGSNTLKEEGFEKISSATIRNYFSALEKEGYLHQQHASGGRVPTEKAFRFYANKIHNKENSDYVTPKAIKELANWNSKEINPLLEMTAECISNQLGLAVFLSAPRFDHDIIIDLKLISIDPYRLLAVIITDFGVVKSEILYSKHKLSSHAIKRIEDYFHYRLTGTDKPENLSNDEEELATNLYNELMMRYVIAYSSFKDEDIYRTGFSKLFAYSDFEDTARLAEAMALFENTHSLRLMLREATKKDKLKFWIGTDLKNYMTKNSDCMVVAKSYHISKNPVGSIGVIGPIRMPYKKIFKVLQEATKSLSKALTNNIFKFKIAYREPDEKQFHIPYEEKQLLEDQTKKQDREDE